ncbi:DUF4277 domain-containing protein [Kitasatospora sp. NPDC048296]|uniref:DUF4277 domain-containing protein n=1 Tax=Kitasatospora sp. NPDC048296 TaxID=3364048 RepID=UPI0037171DA1
MAGIVDELCPIREVAHLTHGQVIEVLIVNRLSAPVPLVRVGDWARDWAVDEVFGIAPDLLGDDRLARTLDAVAPHLDKLVGTVGAQAVTEFGIDVSRIHWESKHTCSNSSASTKPDPAGWRPKTPCAKRGASQWLRRPWRGPVRRIDLSNRL